MRNHTITHCGSPGTTHHGVRKSNLSFLKRHQPLIVEHPKHVTSGERNTMCGNISRNSGLTGPQKVHVSLFWRMKRHLAKLKAAKATSHGKSTVTGHGESTTGGFEGLLGFFVRCHPALCSGLVVLCASCFKIARAVEFVWISGWIKLHCWILTVTMS